MEKQGKYVSSCALLCCVDRFEAELEELWRRRPGILDLDNLASHVLSVGEKTARVREEQPSGVYGGAAFRARFI
ncbi:hypothetical protein Trco_001733 [Trichoderma cornu-damae]|uniref:Uncharacterized protein n=1 Tax=Trichoderma cornu-damae TaxID=654480 RepID=A0A9P8QTL6_9HYPO|nr:hypothetical protein Trco_001733 [Trichoderma cornu-damae]